MPRKRRYREGEKEFVFFFFFCHALEEGEGRNHIKPREELGPTDSTTGQ